MTQCVYLHPGPLKTGTTYLQSLLTANQGAYLAQGFTIFGDQGSLHRAANELMGRKSPLATQVPKGAWSRTRAAVLRCRGDVVMSCERFSLFGVEHVRRVLEDLADREVHTVLTLRDPVAVLPARWQEGIKNGGTATWVQFQERVADNPAQMRKMTRAMSTLEAWAAALPAERIHVVTVPPPSGPRTLLFERFCEALGADPSRLETFEAAQANPSMDLVTTELIRRVNSQRAVQLSAGAQDYEIKSFLAPELAGPTRWRPELTTAALEAAKAESQALIRRIETGGFQVVGNLNDLTSSTSAEPTGTGVDVNPEELLDAAAVAVAALAQRGWARGERLRKYEARRWPARARRVWRRVLRR